MEGGGQIFACLFIFERRRAMLFNPLGGERNFEVGEREGGGCLSFSWTCRVHRAADNDL